MDADVDRPAVKGGEPGKQRPALGQSGVVGLVIANQIQIGRKAPGWPARIDAHPDGRSGLANCPEAQAVGVQVPSTKIAS